MEEDVGLYPLGKLNFSDNKKKITNFDISKQEKRILQDLAKQKEEVAANPKNQNKINLWKDLNSLKKVRPLVWINEIPWHEMNVDDELTLSTKTEFARYLEIRLRRAIYLWKHMPVDIIIEPTLPCYLHIDNTGFGISEKINIATTDKDSDIISRGFTPQIRTGDDIEKIKTPKVTLDAKTTQDKFHSMTDIFDGILKIEKKGIPGFWFAPWDELIRWWGVQEALTDLVLRPKLVHKVMERLTNAYLAMLDQYENQNLLDLNNCNYRIGSGGIGYTDELPGDNFDPNHIKTSNMWGCGAAQIFSDVSPAIHYEFALKYEIKWMKRFGLNYYGCCEPLHRKIDILKKIPNLRKISMSPWVNLDQGAEVVGNDYVFSYKPSPAIFVKDSWDPENIKNNLKRDLAKIKNCVVEVIMKDISTVKYKPERLWQWAEIAMKVVEESV